MAPDQAKLLTTDGTRLITVLIGGRISAARRRSLAEAVARSYLGPPRPKAAAQTEV